jgi:hypothetical protein
MSGSRIGEIASSSKPKPYEYAYRYSDIPPPTSAKVCYKLVAISGGRFVSIYDGTTEYEVGCTMHQEVAPPMRKIFTASLKIAHASAGPAKSWWWLLRL